MKGLPTLAAAADVALPPGASPDGMSDWAAFTDPERAPGKRTEALFQGTGSYALRQGDWLYIPKQGSGGMTVQVPPRAPWGLPYATMKQRNSDIDPQGKVYPDAPPAQLYNLRDDLPQTTNRFRDQPDTARRLAARMEELLPKPTRPKKQ
jgi:arylsulfatase A-like enzyme